MKKITLSMLLLISLVLGVFFYQEAKFYDGKLHVVFCDVGEGDAILIRTSDFKNVLIDGGPDDSVLDCLSNHLPFWERKIDVIFLSHPHADHLNGLISVLERYNVMYFFSENVENQTILEKVEKQILAEKKLTASYFSKGDQIVIAGKTKISTIWPPKELVKSRLNQDKNGNLDVNGLALAQLLTYGNFKVLFTSDLEVPYLDIIASDVGRVSIQR